MEPHSGISLNRFGLCLGSGVSESGPPLGGASASGTDLANPIRVRVSKEPGGYASLVRTNSGGLAPEIEKDAKHYLFGKRPVCDLAHDPFEDPESIPIVDFGERDLIPKGNSPHELVIRRVRTTCSIHYPPRRTLNRQRHSRSLGLYPNSIGCPFVI